MWKDGCTDRPTDERVDRRDWMDWADGLMDEWMDAADGWIDGQMAGLMERCMDVWMDWCMSGWMGRMDG